mmetsp:Transcript_27080/g.42354  ORF Transcript_27080/g.42354 Transcript_27080/m.42354 type:complete len:383 (-) Transcript_27080:139-1287(-)
MLGIILDSIAVFDSPDLRSWIRGNVLCQSPLVQDVVLLLLLCLPRENGIGWFLREEVSNQNSDDEKDVLENDGAPQGLNHVHVGEVKVEPVRCEAHETRIGDDGQEGEAVHDYLIRSNVGSHRRVWPSVLCQKGQRPCSHVEHVEEQANDGHDWVDNPKHGNVPKLIYLILVQLDHRGRFSPGLLLLPGRAVDLDPSLGLEGRGVADALNPPLDCREQVLGYQVVHYFRQHRRHVEPLEDRHTLPVRAASPVAKDLGIVSPEGHQEEHEVLSDNLEEESVDNDCIFILGEGHPILSTSQHSHQPSDFKLRDTIHNGIRYNDNQGVDNSANYCSQDHGVWGHERNHNVLPGPGLAFTVYSLGFRVRVYGPRCGVCASGKGVGV